MLPFPVSEGKAHQLVERMRKLGIVESDLEESFVRSGGAGGQHVNKTSTCVVLLHKPSGVRVRCQQERSQAMNRFLARRWLLDKIEQIQEGKRSAIQQEREKIRRQKRRRSRRAKQKMLEAKHRHSDKKAMRREPFQE
jgi:protein subunit release factor B